MFRIEKFWNANRENIKTGVLIVAVPMAVIGVIVLSNINRINKIIYENNLNELFYGDLDEESEEDLNGNVEEA